MTLTPEKLGPSDAENPDGQQPVASTIAPAPRKSTTSSPAAAKKWWQRQWIIPLWAVVIGFLWYQMTPILSVPPDEAPVSPHPGFLLYYPALIVHMTAGTIAMLTACLQVWTWFRRKYPKAHRIAGRLYVFAGAIPGFLSGMTIVWFAPASGKLGVMFSVTGWVVTAVAGWVLARRHNYVLHRRFMLYSFAFVMNNLWGVIITYLWTKFNIQWDIAYMLEADRWAGTVINLILVQWWLYRTANRPVY